MQGPVEVRRPAQLYARLVVRRFGTDETLRQDILEGVGVSATALEDPRTEIDLSQLIRLIDNMDLRFGEGWLLDAPEIWALASMGPLGVAITTAPTVEAAVTVVARYSRAQWPNQSLKLVRNAHALALRPVHHLLLPVRLTQFLAEFLLLNVSSALGACLGETLAGVRIAFAWPAPDHAARLAQALGGEVRWCAPSTVISVPSRLLALGSPLADAAFHRAAIEQLDQSLQSTVGPEGVRRRVELLLANSETGRISRAAAGRALGLSQRTLIRRLAETGPGYHDLVDAELKSRTRRLLDQGDVTRAEMAAQLGFAETSSFNRACRRWFRIQAEAPLL